VLEAAARKADPIGAGEVAVEQQDQVHDCSMIRRAWTSECANRVT
jgi:hypothetical protein